MKLLFDQNISYRIIKKISKAFPKSKHVKDIDLHNSKDSQIWEYAGKEGFTIITFDADFYDLSLVKGVPPKIVWLRTGNTSTEEIANLLLENADLINEFIQAKEYQKISCLEIM